MVGKGCRTASAMIDAVKWSATALFVAQILVDSSLGYPMSLGDDPSNNIPGETTRSKRSPAQLICQPKTHVTQSSGVINSPRFKTPSHDGGASCTWVIHVSSAQRVQLQFLEFNIVDTCPGTCKCNYVAIKEPSRKANPVSRKYCNERIPPRVLSARKKLKIHFRLKAGSKFKNSKFSMNYWLTSSKEDARSTPLPPAKVPRNHSAAIKPHDPQFIKMPAMKKTIYSEARIDEEQKRIRVREVPPSRKQGVPTAKNSKSADDDKEQGPTKMTVLLAVAIPVVMIFILVVLIIAYYNHVVEDNQMQGKEDIPNSGSAIGDMILNSGATLAPMFNLKKAKRESSDRREKANKLYDDMLLSWKETHANKKEIMRAKQESVDVWESYQASRKQRRNTRECDKSDSKAFAMLLSSAINVSTTPPPPPVQDKKEPAEKEEEEEEEVKPRPSSILINRISSDDIRHKRSSKVLSWSDVSTKSKEEPVTRKRAASEMELKPRGSAGNIPAIVVSQPSFEVEDDKSEAIDTDRLLEDDVEDGAEETDSGNTQSKSSKPTYSCSEHVKDILRESYGEELEDWWQKEKKSEPQSDDVETKLEKKDTPGSLKHLPNSDVQNDAAKLLEEDDVD